MVQDETVAQTKRTDYANTNTTPELASLDTAMSLIKQAVA